MASGKKKTKKKTGLWLHCWWGMRDLQTASSVHEFKVLPLGHVAGETAAEGQDTWEGMQVGRPSQNMFFFDARVHRAAGFVHLKMLSFECDATICHVSYRVSKQTTLFVTLREHAKVIRCYPTAGPRTYLNKSWASICARVTSPLEACTRCLD